MRTYLYKSIRITLIFYCVLILVPITAVAQIPSYYKPFYNDQIMSRSQLKTLISKTKPDTNRVKYLLAIADTFMDLPDALQKDMDSVGFYLRQADVLATHLGSEKWKHNTLMAYGQFYAEQMLPAKQEDVYKRAILLSQQSENKALEAESWFYYYNNIKPDNDGDISKVTAAAAERAYLLYHATHTDKMREAEALKYLADYHLQQGYYDLAEKEMLQVLAFYTSIKYKEIYYSYDLLSAIYNHKGDLSKALYYALCTVKACQKDNKELEGIFIRRVAEAYAAIGKRKESIEWYTSAFNHYADRNEVFYALVLSELATEMIYNNEAGKALDLIIKTRKRFPQQDDFTKFWFDMSFGEGYTAVGKYDKAAPHINNVIKEIRKQKDDNELSTHVYFNVGEFYYAQKRYDKAHYYFEMAAQNKRPGNLPILIRLYKRLFEINIAQNSPAEAIINLQKYHKLQDSVFTQEKINTIERLQIEFSASQKENENEILRKKSQLQSQQLDRDHLIKRTTFGGLGFLSLVIILLYNRFNLKKRVNAILIKQKKSIDAAYVKLEESLQQKNKLIQEKEGLLKEVHHRVKNNLQLTMSLLNSQSYYLEDPSAIAAIRESQHRIKSIALIHQKLYQTDHVATISINPYVSELVNYLRDSIGDGKHINFDIDVINLEMDIAQAVPLGLFLNEAITNIFKYAFPDTPSGNVLISLHPYDKTRHRLRIKDNGTGLPDGFDEKQCNTLGMTLMKGLSTQMDGELCIENDEGLTISLIFENKESDPLTLND